MDDLQPILIPPPTNDPLSLIRLAVEKGLDPDQLGKLMDLAERMERNKAAEAFAYAIKDFQGKMPSVLKSNPVKNKSGELMYNFANFDDIMDLAQPILNDCGITVTFSTAQAGQQMTTTCRVRVGIHSEESSITLSLPAIPNANDSQKAGGALSYGKRYSFQAALNIRIKGEDDDARSQVECLTPNEIQQINDLLEECKGLGKAVDFARFKEWLGVESLGEVPRSDFSKAMNELTRKRKGGQK